MMALEEVGGLKKAAILMIALGPETSAEIMKILPDSAIQKISYEISNIDYIKPEQIDAVVEEYMEMSQAREYVLDGGIDYAKDLLNKALGPKRAQDIIGVLNQIQLREKPFDIARRADTTQLSNLLQNEHPQTVALVLSYIQPEKAASILSDLPEEVQIEIAERIGTFSRTSPTIINKIEKVIEDKFSNYVEQDTEAVGGVPTLVEILNMVGRTDEKSIISGLQARQPELADEVKSSLFTFEDIITLSSNDVQKVLRDVEQDDLVLALKGVSDQLAEFIYGNVSDRAAASLQEDLKYLGPARLSSVEEAQQKIVAVIRRLDEMGEIYIRRGDQDAIVT